MKTFRIIVGTAALLSTVALADGPAAIGKENLDAAKKAAADVQALLK